MAGQNIIICNDISDIGRKGARIFAKIGREAISRHGIFTVALSGGKTPEYMYTLITSEIEKEGVDTSKIHLFWGDERTVPPDHPESNYLMARESLINSLNIPTENIHRINGEKGIDGAIEYEAELKRSFGLKDKESPVFDLILLGMGEDGHTASIFPHSEVVNENERLVVAVFIRKIDSLRITITPPVIHGAVNIIVLVSGEKKRDILREALEGEYNPDLLPIHLIRSASKGTVIWLIDREAGSSLSLKEEGEG